MSAMSRSVLPSKPKQQITKRKRVATRYSIRTTPFTGLGEQLRLFAFNGLPRPSPEVLRRVQQELSTREKLAILLGGELNFHGEGTGYASHDLHAFAAKFPPQLPRAFIRGLTEPGEIILDPMMGSGTAVVEAVLEGRRGIGLDIDPLALRLTQVKTTPSDPQALGSAAYKVILRAKKLTTNGYKIDRALATRFDDRTKAFIDYWFAETTQRELMALVLAIQEIADPSARRFLELNFSSIIVTKSGGVSRARDLAHSRPHLDSTKMPKNAIDQFTLRLRKNLASIADLKTNGAMATATAGDARCMPFADETIDLIITSPPYANAIDYMRAHKFSLVWFGESVEDLSRLRAEYIGSERRGQGPHPPLPDRAGTIIRQLAERDLSKAGILRKYFVEMRAVLGEMYRVLRHDSAAVVVVGTSVMRGLDVQTHECLADMGGELGFAVVGVVQRTLDRNKRMMPARFGRKTDSMIEQRMHEEYVIGFLKPGLGTKGSRSKP